MKVHLFLLLVVSSIALHAVVVDTCSCSYQLPYQQVCGPDFTINATILSENITSLEDVPEYFRMYYEKREYKIEVHDVYNPPGEFKSAPHTVQSFGAGSMCGIFLDVGSTYILSGYGSGDVLGVGVCGLHMDISGHARSYVEGTLQWIDCNGPPPSDEIQPVMGHMSRSAVEDTANSLVQGSAEKTLLSSAKLDSFIRAIPSGINRGGGFNLDSFVRALSSGINRMRANK